MPEKIITVDALGRSIGEMEKYECHRSPILHRAFSVFIYNGRRLLLQKRNEGKYHSGGLWTNACCSHHKSGVIFENHVQARLHDELGITCPVRECFQFVYYHQFHENLYEYEYDHVFLGCHSGPFFPAPDEISELRWVEPEELMDDTRLHPEHYTVWFLTALTPVLNAIVSEN